MENEAGSRPRSGSPPTRALRHVVQLNEEIGYQVRRIMGLKDTDYAAMAVLMRTPLGPTELAKTLHITSAAATAVVDRLVRAGHAVRYPHPEDRRRMIIKAVDSTREKTMEHIYPMMGMVDEQLMELEPAGRQAVFEFLSGLESRLMSYRDDLETRPVHNFSSSPPGEAHHADQDNG